MGRLRAVCVYFVDLIALATGAAIDSFSELLNLDDE